jgi:hypothetical protein
MIQTYSTLEIIVVEVSMAAKRTTHRSSKGTKLYAVRGKKGEFKDIQTTSAHTVRT